MSDHEDSKNVRLVRPVYSLLKTYPRKIVRRMWIALRTERQKFRGREVFIKHINKVLSDRSETCDFTIEDGKHYKLPDAPSAETVENFLNSISFSIDSLDYIAAGGIPFDRTLRYLHAYLWCVKPAAVEAWESSSESAYKGYPIGNLDESDVIVAPHTIMPESFFIFKTRKSGFARSTLKIYSSDDPSKIDFKSIGWEMLGVIHLRRLNRFGWSKIFLILPDQWSKITSNLLDEDKRHEEARFDTTSAFLTGPAIARKSTSFQFSRSKHMLSAEVERRFFDVVISYEGLAHARHAAGWMNFEPDPLLEWINNNDYTCLFMHLFGVDFGDELKGKHVAAIPLNNIDKQVLSFICSRIG